MLLWRSRWFKNSRGRRVWTSDSLGVELPLLFKLVVRLALIVLSLQDLAEAVL